jgi:uncharacterized protein (DUF885 family)
MKPVCRWMGVLAALALTTACTGCSSQSGTSVVTSPSSAPAASTTVSTAATTTTVAPAGKVLAASLQGLPFEEFVDASFDALLLRTPQKLTEFGLAARYGLRNDRLNDRSDDFLHDTMEMQAAILDLLRTYDRGALDPDQRVAYDVYEWALDNLVRGHPYAYHDYPLNSFLYSYHVETVDFFTDLFPLESAADAEDYVACVGQIRTQAGQVLEGLRIREQLGVYPPDSDIAATRRAMLGQLGIETPDPSGVNPRSLDIYTSFADRTRGIPGLSAEDRAVLLDELAEQLTESFVPAWIELIEYLAHLKRVANADAGVWKLPDGDAYYAYLLRSETTTDLSAEEIHQLGLAEVARIQGEMRAIFAELGYPPDEPLADSMGRAVVEGGLYEKRRVGSAPVIEDYEALIEEVSTRIEPVFGLLPEGEVEVVGETWFAGGGGYYVPGSLDGSRPGAFHTGIGSLGSVTARYRMPTTVYHEAVPGHHVQLTLALELDLSLMQKMAAETLHNGRAPALNGFIEGWALYAERLAWELGLYEDDPYGNLGRLNMELLRAVRLVTDTGIHALGWTQGEAKTYVNQAMGEVCCGSDTEVDRYIAQPAQATSYLVGMLRILELRQRAQEALGEHFDLAAFHDVVLGHGSVPLEVLEGLVDDWIETAGAS